MTHSLDCIFNPKGVAIIGASQDQTKRGYQAVRALKESGYPGGIYPVNPKGGELLGLPVARSISEIDGEPDLALVCTPARTVPAVLEECAGKGIRGAVVLALGFRESGEEGKALEASLSDVVRRTGIRVVGPNTSGLLNLPRGLNLVGVRGVRPGRLALLVQSGNMALALMTEAMARSSQGFSSYVGVGNETDIAYHEYLDYLHSDPHTAAILLYVEGFKEGRKFLEVACRVTATKPVVVLKGGRSDSGRASAKSHTGAIAGSYAVLHAALKQVGVVEVTRTDELFHVAETLACQPPVQAGLGIALLSDGGGHGTLAADTLHDLGVPLARLSSATQERLRGILGPTANVANPIDVGGPVDSDPSLFVPCLQALMDDESAGGVLQIGLFGGYHIRFAENLASIESTAAKGLVECAAKAEKPLVVHSLYAPTRSAPLQVLTDGGVPVVASVEVACRCIAASYERGQFLSQRGTMASPPPKPAWTGFTPVRREGRNVLLETEARELVAQYGIPLVPATLCTSAMEVAECVAKANEPIALKVVSAAIAHKTDAGGVILNIGDAEAAKAAFHRIQESAIAYATARRLPHDFRGGLVVPMLPSPVAEIIIGVRRDEQFGPVLTFGLGGVAIEVLRDVALRVLPIGREDALEMLDEIRAAALLRGWRGRPSANREALVELMLALADCALANPEIAEIELNPIFAYSDKAVAVDVRAYLTIVH